MDPFLGEIRLVSFNWAPSGWALCDGRILSIQQNQALFSLLGTTYGGNGTTTFALPNLQGRTPIHASASYPLGSNSGEARHTLAGAELPGHTHLVNASSNTADQTSPAGNYWANGGTRTAYASQGAEQMSAQAIANAGAGQSHENWSPYLVLNFVIALIGIYPSRD